MSDAPADAPFTISKRGYDPREVHRHLDELHTELAALRQQRDEAEERSRHGHQEIGHQIGELLQHAREWADRMVADAETEAAKLRERGRTAAARATEEAEAKASAIISEAEAEAKRRAAGTESRIEELGELERLARARMAALKRRLQLAVEQLEDEDGGAPELEAPDEWADLAADLADLEGASGNSPAAPGSDLPEIDIRNESPDTRPQDTLLWDEDEDMTRSRDE